MRKTEWPKWMDDYPYDFWDEEELNKWLKLYHSYVECQALKKMMREENPS